MSHQTLQFTKPSSPPVHPSIPFHSIPITRHRTSTINHRPIFPSYQIPNNIPTTQTNLLPRRPPSTQREDRSSNRHLPTRSRDLIPSATKPTKKIYFPRGEACAAGASETRILGGGSERWAHGSPGWIARTGAFALKGYGRRSPIAERSCLEVSIYSWLEGLQVYL